MESVIANLPALLDGAIVTIEISLTTILLATVLGIVLIVLRMSSSRLVSRIARGYINCFQNVPYLVIVFLFYFGLPEVGIYFGTVSSTIIGLTVYSAAYVAEAIRGGVLAIPKEQLSGAAACALPTRSISFRIVVPQALVYSLPAMTNQWVRIIMNSTVLSILGGTDLLDQTRQLASQTFQVYAFYTVGALGYWLMAAPLTMLMKRIETVPAWRRAQLGLPRRKLVLARGGAR